MQAIIVEKKIPRMLLVKTLRPFWPGVVWSALSPARLVDLGEPPLPGRRFLRVRNLQCGICATDLSLLFVKADPSIAPAALPGTDRFYLGHEVVGEVVELGEEVTRVALGDRVVMESRFTGPNCRTQGIEPACLHCAGGATRLCENASAGVGLRGVGGGWGQGFTAHEEEIWPVDARLSNDQAALIEPSAVALHGVLRKAPQAGQQVLVVGAGIIGLLTIQAARIVQPDCRITAIARYPHQAAMARSMGADQVLQDGEIYSQLSTISGAHYYPAPLNRGMLLGGFEVVYDCVGSRQTLTDSLRWARGGGTVVLLGVTLGSLKVDLNPVWYQEVDLLGSLTFGPEPWADGRHTFELVMEMMAAGRLGEAGLITHRFPFKQYRRAIAAASDKRRQSIKVMLEY